MLRPRLLLTLIPLVAGSVPVSGQEPTPSVLSGDWKLDENRSEDLEHKVKNRGGRMSRPITGGGRRGGGGNPPGFAGGMGDPGQMMSALRPAQQLSITGSDSAVTFRVDLGLPRRLFLDGREVVDTLGDMTPRRSKARWKDGKLEVSRQVGPHGRAREIYWLDQTTGLLFVDVKVEGLMKVELRRVYAKVSS